MKATKQFLLSLTVHSHAKYCLKFAPSIVGDKTTKMCMWL